MDNSIYGKPARHYQHKGIDRYCAPWCGMHCTHESAKKANRESNDLAKRLGAGWVPIVWENLGWHYSADNLKMSVRPSTRWTEGVGQVVIGYTAYFNGEQQFVEDGDTPEEAVANVLAVARRHVNRMVIDLAPFNEGNTWA